MSIKTNKSISKRFKITGSGKMLRRKPGHSHLMRKRTTRQKRGAREDRPVGAGLTARLRKLLPFI